MEDSWVYRASLHTNTQHIITEPYINRAQKNPTQPQQTVTKSALGYVYNSQLNNNKKDKSYFTIPSGSNCTNVGMWFWLYFTQTKHVKKNANCITIYIFIQDNKIIHQVRTYGTICQELTDENSLQLQKQPLFNCG